MTTATPTSTPMAHSYSRLQTYTECPLSYKLTFIDKLRGDDGAAMEIGSAAHDFFEKWVSEGYKAAEGLDDNGRSVFILELAARCFQREARDQSNFKEFLELCETFARAYKPASDSQSISELQLAFDREWKETDWFAKNVYFRAKIDRLDAPLGVPPEQVKRIKIVDYKTGYAGSIDSFQLDTYAYLGSLIYPNLDQIEVEFYYTKSGFRSTKLLEVKDMGIVKVQLEALMDKIESDKKFKAKPGQRCLNCSVASYCKEKPSDLVAIAELADAEKLATDVALLESQAKAKKKALNIWCKEKGPVSAGGLMFSFWPRESMVVDFGPVLQACLKHNVDPSDVFNPDTTNLRKVIRKNPAFGEAITPYVTMDVSYSFSSRKSGEE